MHALTASLLGFLMLLLPGGGWLGVYLAGDREEAVVTEVVPGSPAAKAGLRAGDVLVAVGDTATPTRDQLIATIGAASPGERVAIKVERDGKQTVVMVKLGERPSETAVAETARPAPARRGGRPAAPAPETRETPQRVLPPAAAGGVYLGISVTEEDGKLMIERVLDDSPAAAAGLRAGVQLVSVGDHRLASLADLDEALGTLRPGKPVAIGMRSPDRNNTILRMLTPAARGGGGVAIRKPVARPVEETTQPEEVTEPPPERRVVRALRLPGTAEAPAAREPQGVEAELEALRRELAELKKELQELRKQIRRGGGR